MSKVSKIISVVAAVVAIAVGTYALLTGNPVLAAIAFKIAGIASAVSAVAGAISVATAKRPDAKGSVNQIMIGRNLPVPYAIGRTYLGGMQIYDNSAGTDNRERTQIMVVTAAGPIQGFEALSADYVTINFSGGVIGPGAAFGYYATFLWADNRLGLRPDTAILAPAGLSPLTGWGAAYKTSGFAAYSVTMKFDKDGKRFASGVPQWGVVGKMVKIYDPRRDSTYPGGSGAHRFADESTFTYGTAAPFEGENPALHALTYARGRFIEKDAGGAPLANPVRIVGCGLKASEIEMAQFVELANLCDANNWKVGGVLYEAPGESKWENLKRILAAAAAEPTWAGGKLGVKISAPRVSVVTIGAPDLTDGEASLQAMKGWRDKVNTIVPRVRLENQKWEYVQLAEVTSATYLAEDGGESKSLEVQFDLVQQKDQGAQLAAYTLVNGREFGPITLPLKPYFQPFKIGEAATINLPELGLANQVAIITSRQIDPATGAVMLTLESETPAKHAFALGRTGVAPPSAVLIPPDTVDQITGGQQIPQSAITSLVLNSSTANLTLSITTAGVTTISNHNRVYADKTVAVTGTVVTPAPAGAAGDVIAVFYDDPARAGGAVAYQYRRLVGGAGQVDDLFASAANPSRHLVSMLTVPPVGSPPVEGGSGVGPGTGGSSPPGGGYQPRLPEP